MLTHRVGVGALNLPGDGLLPGDPLSLVPPPSPTPAPAPMIQPIAYSPLHIDTIPAPAPVSAPYIPPPAPSPGLSPFVPKLLNPPAIPSTPFVPVTTQPAVQPTPLTPFIPKLLNPVTPTVTPLFSPTQPPGDMTVQQVDPNVSTSSSGEQLLPPTAGSGDRQQQPLLAGFGDVGILIGAGLLFAIFLRKERR